jgi:C-5 cytosine-specific DNA methylase
MNPTPVIDMFSSTVSAGLEEHARPVSFSDTYGPARAYLCKRFLGAQTARDFREQTVSEGSIITIGAPCQDLSVAGKRVRADDYLLLKKKGTL